MGEGGGVRAASLPCGAAWRIIGLAMYLRQLDLTNYRNFRKASLSLVDGPIVFRGDNGQGKSNLLEAVELLAAAKSWRAGTDRELIHWAALQPGSLEPFARVRGAIDRETQEVRAEILIQAEVAQDQQESPEDPFPPDAEEPPANPVGVPATRGIASKRFRVNGVPRRAMEFVGTVNA